MVALRIGFGELWLDHGLVLSAKEVLVESMLTSPGKKFRHTKVRHTSYGPTFTSERFREQTSEVWGFRV